MSETQYDVNTRAFIIVSVCDFILLIINISFGLLLTEYTSSEHLDLAPCEVMCLCYDVIIYTFD